MNIDIIRTSASRPDLLKISTQSILDHLKFSGKINWFLHEDVLNTTASEECVQYSKSLNIYKEIKVNNPSIGHTKSFYWLTEHITSPYFMFWEDDYELLQVYKCLNPECKKKTTNKYKNESLIICKHCGSNFIESPTDLDVLISLMENNAKINQICFPKRDIMPDKPGFLKKEVKFDDTVLTVCQHWYISPAIWRTSFINPIIERTKSTCPDGDADRFGWHWSLNRILKGGSTCKPAPWIEENVGTYYLGEIRSGHRIYHLGTGDKSLRNKEYKW